MFVDNEWDEDKANTMSRILDKENPEWTEEDFKRAKPTGEILPHLITDHRAQVTSTPVSTPSLLPWPTVADQFLLRPGIAFLNHGSFGACPRPVFETYQRWQRELEGQPVEFLSRSITGRLAEARASLAAFVGTQADNVVFVPNATTGVNIVAHSLELAPGDEVLATSHEYGAAERAWRFHCERRGVHYISQPITFPIRGVAEFVDELWQGVTDRTRVIFLSHITSPTALLFPVAEVCRRAREAGILTVIDGAHAPGQVDLALDTLGVDFYTGNCHKWLNSPKGAGFLYVRPELQQRIEPLIVSWGWRAFTPSGSTFLDYLQWTGTDDPSAYLSVPAAIEFQQTHDWANGRAACHSLALEARARVKALTGLEDVCPDDWFGQMCVLPLPSGTLDKLGARLWDEHQIEIPQIRWQDREFLRISIQVYNSFQDVERLVDALKPFVQR